MSRPTQRCALHLTKDEVLCQYSPVDFEDATSAAVLAKAQSFLISSQNMNSMACFCTSQGWDRCKFLSCLKCGFRFEVLVFSVP